MTIKLYNVVTQETIIKEVLEYTDHSITEQAGRGIMYTSFDDDWVITEYNEETDNNPID
jgi:hypothetical protein